MRYRLDNTINYRFDRKVIVLFEKRMSDPIDLELIDIINKLAKIQEQVGGSSKKASAAIGGRLDLIILYLFI